MICPKREWHLLGRCGSFLPRKRYSEASCWPVRDARWARSTWLLRNNSYFYDSMISLIGTYYKALRHYCNSVQVNVIVSRENSKCLIIQLFPIDHLPKGTWRIHYWTNETSSNLSDLASPNLNHTEHCHGPLVSKRSLYLCKKCPGNSQGQCC